jgi:ATP synthase protein I
MAAMSTQPTSGDSAGSGAASRPAARTVAGRRHQPWASRWNGGRPEGQASAGRAAGQEVLSYLIAGVLAYGGLGWLVGRYTHIQMLFPIGMLVGAAISLGWIVYRYGRQR